jgi:prevent-host-death family protein
LLCFWVVKTTYDVHVLFSGTQAPLCSGSHTPAASDQYSVLFARFIMKLSTQVRPISYLKAHAAEIVRNQSGSAEPLVITQNGEAKVVMQGIESYEETQETLALLKILALGMGQVEAGKVQPASEVMQRLRARSQGER